MKGRGWIVLLILLTAVLWTLSCGSAPTATPLSEPTPTPSPRQVIEVSGARMTALKTARFTLEQQGQSAALFFGVELNLLKGEVRMTDRFELRVEATSTFIRSFIEINIIGVGDRAFLTNPITGEWNEIPTDDLPFNFANLGHTLRDIIRSIQDPRTVGTEELDGVQSWRVKGVVSSEDLISLASGADSGYQVTLEGWIGQPEGLVRKVRIEGQIFAEDDPNVVRVLTLHGFDEPVEISLPETR